MFTVVSQIHKMADNDNTELFRHSGATCECGVTKSQVIVGKMKGYALYKVAVTYTHYAK